ncbi:hypothetical protein K488DRAFT_76215 [Vararia minispora EC-137]|uniref:Uncharacterized protein n=1 Tax=Vararia minispora EC-137 TaxID=1314806 RepID=A0ACB8QVX8_9AGAM|nr:hypothetical protein K488DRAFT_76215 [Vararia minispora EC-137]
MWHPSMFGFNQTTGNNRPLDPLLQRHFNTSDENDSWWYHGHLKYPPHPEDILQLPVGGAQVLELSCDKGVTSYWQSAPGGNTASANQPDYPCPGQPLSQFHTTGQNDTGGCALAVAYKSNAWEVQPEDFVVFSVNQTCVWTKNTTFPVPGNMPQCPNGLCQCAWFWGHQYDSGAPQIYMTGFQCNFQGATNTQTLPSPNPARRCGKDIYLNRPADPSNCTIGAKQPNYWYQLERNNQFEDLMQPPSYQSLYGFMDGAQLDLYDGIGATQPSGTTPGTPASSATTTSGSGPSKRWSPRATPGLAPPRPENVHVGEVPRWGGRHRRIAERMHN